MGTKNKQPLAIALFAGAGGMSHGFERAGYKFLFANDIEKPMVETYRKNFKDTPVTCEDINNIDVKDLKKLIPKGTELDVVVGGPPCQGFSSAGSKWWDDPRNSLLKSYLNIISELSPRWFVMENVEGILTSANGNYIYEFAKHALDLGYSIRIHKLTFSHYGLPEKRKRVIVVGNRIGAEFKMPNPTHSELESLFGSNKQLSIWDAISDLENQADGEAYKTPPQNAYQELLRGDSKVVRDHKTPELPDIQLKRIRGLQQGQSMRDLPAHLQHPSYAKRANRRVSDGTPSEKRGGAPAGLQRLRADLPSKTITSAAYREFIHPTKDRPLTIRECARIQGFPDAFEFVGSQQSISKQIGNAVPPLIAEMIANEILKYELDKSLATELDSKGKLLGFYLTKATAMSPALKKTHSLLTNLESVYGQRT